MGRMQHRSSPVHRLVAAGVLGASFLAPLTAKANVPVQRTFFTPASSNGHGAVMLDLSQARLTHFREHLFADEEPQIDASGNEIWNGSQFATVPTRDLLFDAYFGLRQNGNQAWLTGTAVDLDKSGYAPWKDGKTGGTGVVTMVQTSGNLVATQYFFAPKGLGAAGFVMAMRIQNTGSSAATGVSAFTVHNFHMGYGRPGARVDIDANGETIAFDGTNGHADLLERGFAGVIAGRALGAPSHHGSSDPNAAVKIFDVVNNGGTNDLPDLDGEAATADDSVSGFQWDFGDLAAGDEKWAGVAFAHHANPFAGQDAETLLDGYVSGNDAKALVTAEIAAWATFQSSLAVGSWNLSAEEETLARQSAVMLAMGQVQDDHAYLREFLTKDGEARYTRFGETLGGAKATLPDTVAHRGKGAVLASLPPGEWTVAWIRDGSYAATAMAALGMKDEARAALSYYLNAESGRFQSWDELKPYSMPPYLISLVRYQGFGVEQTDFNDFGPNLEFDGFGLFLWALQHYEALTGDKTLVDQNWDAVSTKVADVIVALIDPNTGLLKQDSSIWETHWKGRQRAWTYTNITAARGLCDAATLAARTGDTARAKTYKDAGIALRSAIGQHLTDSSRALASNVEELQTGEGYWDAAVLDGIAFGLFDPKGVVAKATLAGLDKNLGVAAGVGWSRNDDRFDHSGKDDTSPWGSEYDSAEWVVTDLRGSVATRLMGDTARSDALLGWVRDQSLANYLAISETYDEATGQYKFNAPMLGFGAGVYALALKDRVAPLDEPACGAYFDETTLPAVTSSSSAGAGGEGGGGGSGGATSTTGSGGQGGSGGSSGGKDSGCGCRAAPTEGSGGMALLAMAAMVGLARKRRR